jgi:hypothetical protein
VEGKRYKDYENDFENELERIGSTSSYYGGYQTTTLNNQKMLGYQYHYLGYTCEVCGKHFKTTEYLEDKVEGEIGRKYKNYLCCNTKMKVDTSDYLVEEFRPSEKLLSLNGKYKNRQ